MTGWLSDCAEATVLAAKSIAQPVRQACMKRYHLAGLGIAPFVRVVSQIPIIDFTSGKWMQHGAGVAVIPAGGKE